MNKENFLEICRNGIIEELQATINEGFNIEKEFSGEHCDLLLSSKTGEVAKFLIDTIGFDDDRSILIDLCNSDYYPICYIMLNSVKDGFVDISTLQVVLKAFENDDEINGHPNKYGNYLIHSAVETGRVDIVETVLQAGGETDLLSVEDYQSPIGKAAAMGNKEIVQLLIDWGSPVKPSDFELPEKEDYDDDDDDDDEDEDEDEDEIVIESPIDLAKTDEIKVILLAAENLSSKERHEKWLALYDKAQSN